MITVQFEDEELPELQQLLNRAMNTWDKAPKWAWELDARVQQRLDHIAEVRAQEAKNV